MSHKTGTATVSILPPHIRPIRTRLWSGLINRRVLWISAALVLLALLVGTFSLIVGTANLGVRDLIEAFRGDADPGTTRILLEWRLPRTAFALLGGAALAASGAVFQSLTRNPLGSPDIIGFSTGAYTGALIVGLLGWNSIYATPSGALVGGITAGIAVYALSIGPGNAAVRIVIVGIGVSVFLGAFNSYLLTTMRVEQAISAAVWGAGSLNQISWPHFLVLAVICSLVFPVLIYFGRSLSLLEMGDDVASAIGIPGTQVRTICVLIGLILVAAVTAFAGPIAFVALAAPQLAIRLCRMSEVKIVPAMAMGALMLTTSDLLARTVIPGAQLPVGVITLCIGGGYLLWLLTGFARK